MKNRIICFGGKGYQNEFSDTPNLKLF